MSVRAVLTDIEGTTTSIAFVHDVLFPYARRTLGDFVRAHANDPAIAQQIAAVRAEQGDPDLSVDGVIAVLEGWMAEDRKATPLKALQGHVWVDGYTSGAYTGHVYDDAVRALRRWHQTGLTLAVYSSGSVKAQKLLFQHSCAGDLTPLFSAHFDTTTGHKREVDSYRAIARSLEVPPSEIAFLSDVAAELDAARAAGLPTFHVVRPADGTKENTHGHAIVADLEALPF